ncbi:MAG: TerB family tellurite resistance protein [Desulfobacteraceae bacterium]|jgi:DnaJ like chaperone protein
MSWLGKVIGGAIGFALGGPIGAVAGAVFGHSFDQDDHDTYSEERLRLSNNEKAQMTFFVAAFSMLAKMATADGKICNKELDAVEQFMKRDLQLNSESRKAAMSIFRTAVDSDATFEGFASQFYDQFRTQPRFLEILLDVLIRVSSADGSVCDEEEQLLLSAVRIFHYRTEDYLKLKSRYIDRSDTFHAILGCDRQDSDEFVKKQYRKLVTEYHPDKIASKGLPDEFSKFAADKFREIQEAYEMVKKERGMV